MRRVDAPGDFAAALASARGEARSAFGSDAVLIEKYILRPRHSEVQVFGDGARAVHLFERDCSLQRRHQKVIEEAPAPGMTEEMRAAMGEAAVRAAEAIDYSGAGTVEFIADASEGLRPDGFWFMEMNTRLQVEHPVTEMVTGIDLVEWQLRVASGEPLPMGQAELALNGHAVEARLYAEDPARGFLPATGRLGHVVFPPGARADTGIRAGDAITPHYDPMLAKLIVHGTSRAEALAALRRALASTRVSGVTTNLSFLDRLAAHPGFAAGSFDTGLIDRDLATLTEPVRPAPEIVAVAALTAQGRHPGQSDFTLWAPLETLVQLRHGDTRLSAIVARHGAGYRVTTGDDTVTFDAVAIDGPGIVATIDGRRRSFWAAREGERLTLFDGAEAIVLELPDPLVGAEDAQHAGDEVTAPMPGLVKAIHVAPGETVARGATVAVMEAMKMELPLLAPRDGVVAEVAVGAGSQVAEGALLIALAPDD